MSGSFCAKTRTDEKGISTKDTKDTTDTKRAGKGNGEERFFALLPLGYFDALPLELRVLRVLCVLCALSDFRAFAPFAFSRRKNPSLPAAWFSVSPC
jgi:hypothetical protein